MKKVLLLLFIGLNSQLIGQQSSISGVVAVFNSAFETGTRQYIANAQVEDDFKKATATTSGVDGRFKLVFVGIKDHEKVSFNVKKEKMEIVNTEALYAVAGQKEQVAVFMAPEGKLAENKLKYYNINREAAEKALTAKLKTIGDEILKLKQNETTNAGRIVKLQAEYGALQQQYAIIEQSAREMAERYAKINLDDQTKEYQSAFRYFQKGQLEEALKILNQVDLEKTGSAIVQEQERNRKINKEWVERDSIKNEKKRQVTEGLSFKAELHKTQFEFGKVEVCYELMLYLDSTNCMTLWSYAAYLYQQKQNKRAVRFYLKALKHSTNEEQKVIFLNNLAGIYRLENDMMKSEETYLKALSILRGISMPNQDTYLSQIASIHNGLGSYYRINNNMIKAEVELSEGLQIFRQLTAKDSANIFLLEGLASVLNSLGELSRTNNQFYVAEKYYVEALKIYRKISIDPIFLPDVAGVLNNMGINFNAIQAYDQSELAYLEAIEILKKLAHDNPYAFLPNLANALDNLGVFYYYNEKLDKCEPLYLEALEIQRELVSKNPNEFLPDIAGTLVNIGVYYSHEEKKNTIKAENAYREAIGIYRKLINNNSEVFLADLALALTNIGGLYNDINKPVESEMVYVEAVQILRKLAIKNPASDLPDLARTLNNLGGFYRKRNKLIEAESSYLEALLIYKQVSDNEPAFSQTMAIVLANIGDLYKIQNKHSKALQYYSEALSIREHAILSNKIRFYRNWENLLNRISEVKKLSLELSDFASVVNACKLYALSCDNLKEVKKENLNSAAIAYGELSWWALYIKDYTLSEKAALRCLELDNTQDWVLTNLAHSYLLRGQYSEAILTYEKLKGKKNNEGKYYKQVLLEDLNMLKAEGISHKDMSKAITALEKW